MNKRMTVRKEFLERNRIKVIAKSINEFNEN